MHFYNENDPKMAAWLRELMREKLIPEGVIDERSIADIEPGDVRGFAQCHFFAGIAGWPLALQLADWPEDREVWTGSCPCQPFSAAGKQLGTADSRHLWPEFLRLITIRRPATIFGEQVASKPGREWLSGVFADMEGLGYAVAGADLCAASVGVPHIRQRLFWVADSNEGQCGRISNGQRCKQHGPAAEWEQGHSKLEPCRFTGRLADNKRPRLEVRDFQAARQEPSTAERGGPDFWNNFDLIPCADGKARRVESGTFPLAHGVSGRVGLLRGYGNAIVPQVAAEFIKAFMSSI